MSYSVLIVEDDPMVSMINEQYVLKNSDFIIAGTCRNGKEAIEFLETQTADLILLDVFMPVMNGTDTLKKIRELNISSEVIMITAANDINTIEETMHLGVLDYLIKPFAYERFNIALQKFINKMQLMEGNEVLSQNSLDSLIANNSQLSVIEVSNSLSLPKGIQKTTLEHIKQYFQQNKTWQTVDVISEALGISVVTARNYLNYLVKEKIILEDINYNTGGRPSMIYKKK
ncbi:MAG: response regulator [Treponema sp.]|nr:response regulator [Treponema sp.]